MGISFQLQPNVTTSYRVETVFGTLPANDSTARRFRTNSGAGLSMQKQTISANEVRADLQRTRDRHGPRSVSGSLSGDLSLGSFDTLLEAALRSTYTAPLTSATFTLTSYDQGTGLITRGSGSFIGEGFRVGDVVTFNSAVGANVGRPMILTAVGTTTATVGNRLSIDTVTGPTGVTVTRPKKLTLGTTRRSFSVEHWEPGATSSQRFVGCRVGSLAVTQPPEGMVGVEFGFVGQDMLAPQSSQYFTNATDTTSQPMAAGDAIVCYNGAQVATLSGASLSLDLGLSTTPVIGATISPDVFEGVANVTGSLTFLKQNTTIMSQFVNETAPLSLQLMYREAGTNGFVAINVGSFTVGSVETERIGPSGAQLETAQILVGIPTASDRDASMITLCTSAA